MPEWLETVLILGGFIGFSAVVLVWTFWVVGKLRKINEEYENHSEK